MPSVFERHRVIDTDSHLTEPADLWTSRVPARWAERVPRVERVGAKDVWVLDGQPIGFPGYPHPTCMAPNEATPATHPREYAEEALGALPDAVLARVLHDNAAALYGLQ